MTFLSPLLPLIRGAACVGLAVTLGESIIHPHPTAHKTLTGRAMMQGSIATLTYLSNIYKSDIHGLTRFSTKILLFAFSFFGLMRITNTVWNGSKRFESLFGRAFESAVSLATFSATFHLGSGLGISCEDTFNYTSIALSYAGKYFLEGLSYIPGIVSLIAQKAIAHYMGNGTEG